MPHTHTLNDLDFRVLPALIVRPLTCISSKHTASAPWSILTYSQILQSEELCRVHKCLIDFYTINWPCIKINHVSPGPKEVHVQFRMCITITVSSREQCRVGATLAKSNSQENKIKYKDIDCTWGKVEARISVLLAPKDLAFFLAIKSSISHLISQLPFLHSHVWNCINLGVRNWRPWKVLQNFNANNRVTLGHQWPRTRAFEGSSRIMISVQHGQFYF